VRRHDRVAAREHDDGFAAARGAVAAAITAAAVVVVVAAVVRSLFEAREVVDEEGVVATRERTMKEACHSVCHRVS
jgi:hypothetical protein